MHVREGSNKMRWLDSITDSRDMNLNKHQEIVKGWLPGMLQFMGLQRVGHDLVTEQQLVYRWHNCLVWHILY